MGSVRTYIHVMKIVVMQVEWKFMLLRFIGLRSSVHRNSSESCELIISDLLITEVRNTFSWKFWTMGRPQRRKKTHVNDKAVHRLCKTKRRTQGLLIFCSAVYLRLQDVDQIYDAVKLKEQGFSTTIDPDPGLPGLGQHYCVSCAYKKTLSADWFQCRRHFIAAEHLSKHEKSKIHKQQWVILFCTDLLINPLDFENSRKNPTEVLT